MKIDDRCGAGSVEAAVARKVRSEETGRMGSGLNLYCDEGGYLKKALDTAQS
ncbi:MAG: hypothetical protein GY906_35400 [bacterium]|nr:hypothetical protein [bacterium]